MTRAGGTLLAVAMLSLASCCGYAAAASPPGVEDSSQVGTDGARTQRLSVVVPAAATAVWAAFTTTEGYVAWAAPVAQVDFRLGGMIETSYAADARLGARENIRNEIVAYAPGRMFALRNRQAPPDVPFDVTVFQSLHTVVLFDDLGGDRTRVTIVQPGYGAGEAYERVYRLFEWGNGATLVALRDRFVNGPTDWRKGAPPR